MQYYLWIALCVAVGVVLRHRPFVLVIAAFAIRLFIPSIATGVVLGSHLSLHPATLLLLIGAAVSLLARGDRWVLRELDWAAALYGVFLFVLAAAVISTSATNPQRVYSIINTLVSGVCLLWLVRSAIRRDRGRAVLMMRVVAVMAAVEAAFGIVQTVFADPILFATQHAITARFDTASFSRSFGTLDTPLDLALLCAFAIPLTVAFRSALLNILLPILLLAGVIVTESRSGTIIAVMGLVYTMVRSDGSVGRRIVIGATTIVVSYLAVISNSGLLEGLTGRVGDDNGSAVGRSTTFQYFVDHIWQQPWYGSGYGASYDLLARGITPTSLENGWFMYAWDQGVFFTAVLFCGVVLVVILGAFNGAPVGAVAAALAALAMSFAYSGLANQSAASWILWVAVALAASMSVPKGASDDFGQRAGDVVSEAPSSHRLRGRLRAV